MDKLKEQLRADLKGFKGDLPVLKRRQEEIEIQYIKTQGAIEYLTHLLAPKEGEDDGSEN